MILNILSVTLGILVAKLPRFDEVLFSLFHAMSGIQANEITRVAGNYT